MASMCGEQSASKKRKVDDLLQDGASSSTEQYSGIPQSEGADLKTAMKDVQRTMATLQQTMSGMNGYSKPESLAVAADAFAGTCKLIQSQSQLPNRIRLDVGGKIFATTLSTLTSMKGTFFEGMFGGELRFCALCVCAMHCPAVHTLHCVRDHMHLPQRDERVSVLSVGSNATQLELHS